MIFKRIHVDGFGIWRDLTLDDLSPGLNVLAAPNEGGKSTLMAFIRALLFGFKRRGHACRYEPLRGGTHGGYIELSNEGAHYRVERREGVTSRGDVSVVAADGKELPATKLDSLLHGTTETLYEHVFAFGLDELQALDTLQAEDVAGHIYSAGMSGGTVNPVAFHAKLRAEMAAIYRPRGKRQPVCRLLNEIEADGESIEMLSQRPEEHAELHRRRLALERRLEQHDQRLEQRRARYDEARRDRHAWSHYSVLLRAETGLETLGIPATALAEARRSSRTAVATATVTPASLPARATAQAPAPTASSTAVATALATDGSAVAPDGRTLAGELMSSAQRRLLSESNRIRGLAASGERLGELHATAVARREHARALRKGLFGELEGFGEGWSLERARRIRTDVTARDEIRAQADARARATVEIDGSRERAEESHSIYAAMVQNAEQISRSSMLASWMLIGAGVVLSAVLVPEQARLASTASVSVVGLVIGAVITWLHFRGLVRGRTERQVASQREAEHWQRHEDAKIHEERLEADWQRWLAAEALPHDLTFGGALDLLARVCALQAKDGRADAAEDSVNAALAELQQSCMNVLTLLNDLGRSHLELTYNPLKMVDPLLSTIEALHAEFDSAEDYRERIRKGLDEHSQAIAALRALAGDDGTEALRARLEATDPDSLERAVGAAKGELDSARADRDVVNESLGALREQIRGLENDAELTTHLQRREARRSTLTSQVEEWAVRALAVSLYEQAKNTYESERQPEVLRFASDYLETMTDRRYLRVIAPLGEDRLEIERAVSGERLCPADLSRGTREQLYLALRLALAKVYGARAVALPLVADDILVNFDDDRARSTTRLLADYAADGHQILAFTCHRHLISTFERNAPGASIRLLPAHA